MILRFLLIFTFTLSTFSFEKIVCDKEAYNCPSYRGKYIDKKLPNCDMVRKVWKTCKGDVHVLDRDKDGIPCEKSCYKYFKKKEW